MCHLGQQLVFEEASETMKKLRGVEVTAKQIERVSHYYGEEVVVDFPRQNEENPKEICQWNAPEAKTSPHYVMMDGTMILTREEKWKEVKLGRIFRAQSNVTVSENRNIILHSKYVSHLGGHEEFLKHMEYYTDAIKEKIFIADGAKWIWSWVEMYYPDSVQILDFFHAKEHLCDYAKTRFSDPEAMHQWIEEQSQMLLNDQVEQVIENIRKPPKKSMAEEKVSREKLITYYQGNLKRMKYKTFKDSGYVIGSGAMESAHRTVIQKRLKLSGQRWTKTGAQQILNLRVAAKSDNWKNIIDLTRKAA